MSLDGLMAWRGSPEFKHMRAAQRARRQIAWIALAFVILMMLWAYGLEP